jgi:hypothetical protein
LGPLLFIIYFSSIGKEIAKHGLNYKLYADNILIYISCKSKEIDASIRSLECCVNDLLKWLNKRSLVLNPTKTEFLIVGTPQQIKKVRQKTLLIGGTPIISFQSVRYLGFELDETLSFDKQIGNVSKKAYGNLRMLYRQIRFLNLRARKMAVNSLVGSLIDFCIVLYNGLPKKRLKRLQRLLRSMKRFVEGVEREPIDEQWLTIEQKIHSKIAIFTRSIVLGCSPEFLNDFVTQIESSHNLRSITNGNLMTVRTSTSVARRAFRVTAPGVWNSLSQDVRNKPTCASFRDSLMKELLMDQ